MGIDKKGIFTEKSFSETLLCQYDTNFYTENDGSVWIRVFHHNNPATNLFASTDNFTSSVYIDNNRWFNVSLCNFITDEWELMVKLTTTNTATETKYRWKQKTNPMTATWNDVAVSNVTYNTSSGYSSTTYGGLYCHKKSTYLCANNGTNGNWFGAVGSWTNYKEGIPTWDAKTVTTGYEDLYLRVDKITNTKFSINSVGLKSAHFYEL